ncbi:histidine phosphatase family protein [Sulfitobacter donghicola]|uniref:Phosphoglycerate mutase n=1 Tax=Sulfitobacter donghicola DSW-25 = KCTC 12864 = JCM 14565 TaxID=1300350 RepID=A0A073IJD2_9RHOB|nr:histidine phosphatase family protein [Sulfitobacter donghicola]KEJ89690.1 phosphoglycerate mutase [Sulfitobacter donghicola DSW-25 = KCTC 12864 = JCM 14565]KIN67219.1 Phosphoglycerate mutase [Sulfitobacter donghicola DSW-25 = KCTC 12864 = JCM 14565]
MIRLALLRHGHTTWNREGRVQGRSDIALDADAVAELRNQSLPSPWKDAMLWASPLERAAHTAALVAGREPKTDPALIEMNWGDWEGRIAKELRADPTCDHRDIEDWGWDYTPPNGESPAALRDRLVPWANRLARDSIAVCHIGVMRVLMAHATGWNFAGPAPFAVKRNRLFIIEIDGTAWRLLPEPVRLERPIS